MTRTAVVLFSGGQDSTTCLYMAMRDFDRVVALSVYYGQRHRPELVAAHDIAKLAGVESYFVEIPDYGKLVSGASALIDSSVAEDAVQPLFADGGFIDAMAPTGLPTSFVPGRNAVLLTLAAGLAVRLGGKDIVSGVCQTDYSGYPDCRRDFIDAMETALSLAMPSSAGPIRITTPLMRLTKAQTVNLARGLPGCWEALALSVTCYLGKRPGCKTCPACVLRAKGFADAGVVDPAQLATAQGAK
jgi:7-cyano-7-deazaguanine synthase